MLYCNQSYTSNSTAHSITFIIETPLLAFKSQASSLYGARLLPRKLILYDHTAGAVLGKRAVSDHFIINRNKVKI